MPLLILITIVGAVVGATVRKAGAAFAVTAVLGLVGIVQVVWAVTDGKGDDPAWLIAVGVAAAVLSLGACAGARQLRGWPVSAAA